MTCTISIATDLSVAMGPTTHLGVLVPGPLSTVEAPVPMAWPLGAVAATHRLAVRVLHRGAAIVQHGHDVGPGVVHVPAVADPVAAAKHTLGSRRTVTFGFARVRVGGLEVGLVGDTAAMSCCAEPIERAVGDAPTNRLNSVSVGAAGTEEVTTAGPGPEPCRPRWGPSLG